MSEISNEEKIKSLEKDLGSLREYVTNLFYTSYLYRVKVRTELERTVSNLTDN